MKRKKTPKSTALSIIEERILSGSELLALAGKQFDEEMKKMVIDQISRIIRFRLDAIETVRKGQQAKQFYERQLEAIRSGRFSVTRYGGSATIVFDLPELRKTYALD